MREPIQLCPDRQILDMSVLTHFCPPPQHLLSERRQSLGQQMLERWAKIYCENATVGKNGLMQSKMIYCLYMEGCKVLSRIYNRYMCA